MPGGQTSRSAPHAGLVVCALGPVRLADPVADARLAAGPARELLGVLALRAGERVAPAEIRAALPQLPVRPAAGALRSAFAEAGLSAFLAPDDFRLVHGDRVDVARFQRGVSRALAHLRAGDLFAALDGFERALRLWPRDPAVEALSGVAVHGWAAAQVTRLRELRLSAIEERVACSLRLAWAAVDASGAPVAPPDSAHIADAALAAARADVDGLAPVLVAHPVRERLWELVVVAAYLTGGRRAAAEAYERATAAYADQLGVPPGARLRELALAAERGELGADWRLGEPAARPAARPEPSGAAPAEPASGEYPSLAPLPIPLTSLIGRERLLSEVAGALGDARLVTLTGPGGCGKTRLAVAAARRAVDDPSSRRSAAFVDLAAVDRADRVPAAVATALAVRDEPGLDPVSGIVARYSSGPAPLVVLDNCEHLLGACADLVDRLLDRCPGVRVLATSRSPLRIRGEKVVAVPPLSTPHPGQGHTLDGLAEYPASRLFLDRARDRTGRPLPESAAAAVAALCAELDGLPLAIELAAARTSVLDVPQIAARVRADLRLLSSSDPTAPERHRTLTAAVESSVDLLSPPSRALFARLAVFPGTFDRAAAVALGSPGAPPDPSEALDELVRASLVEPAGGHETRYRLLGTVRRVAQLALFAAGDEPAARSAHAGHYLAVAERCDAELAGPELPRALAVLGTEWPNLLAATAWFAAEQAGGGYGDLRLATALASYCRLRGHYRDGRGWLAAALDRNRAAPPALRAPAAIGAAMLAMLLCDYPAAAGHAERARADCERIGDRRGRARAESILGSIARERGEYAASAEHLDLAAVEYAELGDESGEARMTQLRGFTAWLRGDLDRAEPRLRACLRRFERLGDGEAMADALTHLGAVAHYRGDGDRAAALLDASLERYASLGFPEGVAWAHNLRGLVELAAGHTARAGELLTESLRVHRQVGDRWRTASVLCALAEVARQEGAPRRAARLLGAAARIHAEIGTPIPACERADVLGTEAALRAVLGDAAFDAALDAGRDTPLDGILADRANPTYAYF
ncbi:AfsR/SARP family transcriptional regulator [Rhizomonospora bruguierae]|uniref:AfsR/SARP family transcriptional regulator n=1 Tax=Rhizomonospora bruguierae TaxID=1581705 RepID=UPI001BCEC121|nr:BTAD domain-containing putative transcriptional regulator [Micromonospora sp. NBRC 107566]